MERTKKELEHLGLGDSLPLPTKYDPMLLENFPNKTPHMDLWISFVCPEFTSLCPKTGWPDFATICINYIPDKMMLESKSCKLYLFSFRNHGSFHEDCIQTICRDLNNLLSPRYLEVMGEFNPRGGISLHPFINCSNGDAKYKKLEHERLLGYAPKKYSNNMGGL